MRNHRYDRDFLASICQDPTYLFITMSLVFLERHDVRYLPKERANGDFTMLCPLHSENRPSLRYSLRLRTFKCFGCGKSGSLIGLYRQYYKISFAKAVRELSRLRTPVPLVEIVSYASSGKPGGILKGLADARWKKLKEKEWGTLKLRNPDLGNKGEEDDGLPF